MNVKRDNGAKSRRKRWVQAILAADGSAPVREAVQEFLFAMRLNNYHTRPMQALRARLSRLAGFDFADGQ